MPQWIANFLSPDSRAPLIAAIVGGVIVALLILCFLYLLVFGHRLRLPGGGRARQPRLGLVDAFWLDGQRQLVLVRRDSVEHLLMIGGPTDVVVESQITRVAAAATAPLRDREGAPAKQPPALPVAAAASVPPGPTPLPANAARAPKPAAIPPEPTAPVPPRAAAPAPVVVAEPVREPIVRRPEPAPPTPPERSPEPAPPSPPERSPDPAAPARPSTPVRAAPNPVAPPAPAAQAPPPKTTEPANPSPKAENPPPKAETPNGATPAAAAPPKPAPARPAPSVARPPLPPPIVAAASW